MVEEPWVSTAPAKAAQQAQTAEAAELAIGRRHGTSRTGGGHSRPRHLVHKPVETAQSKRWRRRSRWNRSGGNPSL